MNGYGDSIVIVHPPLVTGYGGAKVPDWAHATRTPAVASVQPEDTAEALLRADTTTSRWTVHCPPDMVAAVDHIEWHGRTYDVDGVPGVLYRQGTADHTEFVMSEVLEVADA